MGFADIDCYSKEIADRIGEVLAEDGRRFDFNDDIGFFDFSSRLEESRDLDCLRCVISVGLDSYVLYGIPPLKADTKDSGMMAAVSRFLHLANYRLHNGNFQINYKTGEIRYKLFHDCQSSLPSKLTILNSILTATENMNNYSNGLLGLIIRRDMSPEEAFEDGIRKQLRKLFVKKD